MEFFYILFYLLYMIYDYLINKLAKMLELIYILKIRELVKFNIFMFDNNNNK